MTGHLYLAVGNVWKSSRSSLQQRRTTSRRLLRATSRDASPSSAGQQQNTCICGEHGDNLDARTPSIAGIAVNREKIIGV